jgi:16S rRNA (uracil1498-N3)-methyltransferase
VPSSVSIIAIGRSPWLGDKQRAANPFAAPNTLSHQILSPIIPRALRLSRRPAETSMARADFLSPRLYVDAPLGEGAEVGLSAEQTHYLLNVLRLREGARVLVFNGRDGEFATRLGAATRKGATLAVGARERAQEHPPDLDYLFAPLKHARLDYVAQKAVEMGARRLRPVLTRRTQASRVNLARLRVNALEAAEQCGVIWLPEIVVEQPLEAALAAWPAERLLIFCDEDAPQANPVAALASRAAPGGIALLVGPEGGFDESERAAILRIPNVLRLSLGPRVLRADTAAVAALALIQAQLGDWR